LFEPKGGKGFARELADDVREDSAEVNPIHDFMMFENILHNRVRNKS
jgi:hypothetical protein